jgi:DNA-binding HxlR family transcriptional regulator
MSAVKTASSTGPPYVPTSALDAALGRVGDRWSFLIVEALLDGPQRFNDLAAAVPGIAPNILTGRLRRLEQEGVVVGQRYSDKPARVAYALTADGRELAGVLRLLAAWGSTIHGSASGDSERIEGVRHVTCGSMLEARWYCPTCAIAIDDEESASLRYA